MEAERNLPRISPPSNRLRWKRVAKSTQFLSQITGHTSKPATFGFQQLSFSSALYACHAIFPHQTSVEDVVPNVLQPDEEDSSTCRHF